MENMILPVSYLIAFIVAFTSVMIELSNKYGSYFVFTTRASYFYLYCSVYGLVGVLGYWLYQSGFNAINYASDEIENPIFRSLLSAFLIGWSAKGLLDAPLLPGKVGDGSEEEGFRLRLLINFLFLNANNRFDNIIAGKQSTYFKKYTGKFLAEISGNAGDGSDAKKTFEKKVYNFLDVHPKYGGGSDSSIVQFNAFMSQLVKEPDLDSSFRFAYRNLGYPVFKGIMNNN